jgi:OHCU decarboxylase
MPALIAPQPTRLDRADFVKAFGSIYEHSPWIAEQAFDEGLTVEADFVDGLAWQFATIVDGATYAQQLTLLQAHPELAGKLAIAGELTHESRREQAGAGLDQCSPAEFDRFQALNQHYRSKFDFPFIIAVGGLNRHQILAAFEQRVLNSRDVEFATALAQVHRIARLRLERMTK